jgi:hypothetical protein
VTGPTSADAKRFKQHSVVLNRVCWRIAELLGDVSDDDDQIVADPDKLVDRLVAEMRDLQDQHDRRGNVACNARECILNLFFKPDEADLCDCCQHYRIRHLIGRVGRCLFCSTGCPEFVEPRTSASEHRRHDVSDPANDDDLLDRAEQQMRDWERGRSIDIRAVIDLIGDLYTEVRALRDQLNEAQLRSIEARNPGIDMDEVRRLRAAGRPPTGTPDTGDDDG